MVLPESTNIRHTRGEYIITNRSTRLARRLNLLIYPSENTRYKLEVYANSGKFLSYIGKNDELDYPYLLEMVKIRLITLQKAKKMRDKWYDLNLDNIHHNRFYWLEMRLLWS